jgi:hypothetical protein
MKGVKLLFLGLVVSVFFVGQAMAGGPPVAWTWTFSEDLTGPTSVNLAPGEMMLVDFSTQLTANPGTDPFLDNSVDVMDSLRGDNVTGTLTADGATVFPISWQDTIGPFSSPGMMTIFNTASFTTNVTGTMGSSNTVKIAVNVVAPTTVPEPSTLLLLGAGLAGVGLLRRRFKKQI